MTTQIIIHILPHEIDWFEWQIRQLKQGSNYLGENTNIIIDVTLNLNFIDWDQSQLPKQFFINKFTHIEKLCDWCQTNFTVDEENKCLGCGDKRKQSIELSNADNIIYLDSDVIFKPETLFYLLESVKNINNKYYIISPQIYKLWDNSWDLIVNDDYINNEYSYSNYANLDPFSFLSKIPNQISIKPINGFKFGGGWFNLLSTNLLKLTNIPESLNPYGPDDTYVMFCCEYMKFKGYDVQQYVIDNLMVIENIKYRNSSYVDFLSSGDNENQRKLFREQSERNLLSEVENFKRKL
jgi:hypothetical protein